MFKKGLLLVLTLIVFFTININTNYAQEETNSLTETIQKLMNGISISGQWFLGYQTGRKGGVTDNEFLLKRGYITFRKTFNKNLSARFTQDVSVDRDGDGEGDIEIRLKYGFLKYEFESASFLTNPQIDFGLVSRPWIDFEQTINPYRVQGSMFLERYGILSSADYGITFQSLIGGELDDEYKKKVNKNFAGKYGSFSFGIYNGGGYHAIEKNENKLLEGRLTIRPLPELLTGFQLTYIGAIGKGNIESSPNHNLHSVFTSYETQLLSATANIYKGRGFEDGRNVDKDGIAPLNSGYSLFGNFNIPYIPFSLFARYDYFDSEISSNQIT
ncbi:MAG: hypothetical protein Q8T08_26375, partial [Ignavibacteria bacterium]|nr:hypothetical protein [Ignavibacteria bacterium]